MTEPHPIPVDALEATHLLVVGTTGSGKTYLLRGLIEQLRRADRRIGAIDKLGKLWGLTLSADAAGPGLDFVVFGGKRQPNVPMTRDDGGRIARLFVERNIPAIFDLSQWTADDQELWVADFATELFLANEAALHLAIDEAQSFVPVNGGGAAFNAVRRLAEQGRGNGVNLMLTAPRLSRVDATVRGAMQGIVAMRQTGTNDRVATAELLAGEAAIDEKALKAELPGLATGTGYVWVPGASRLERVAFPANATFDSSRTPRHGDRPPAPIAVSSTLVDELRAALAPPAAAPHPDDVIPADPIAAYARGSEVGEALAERERRIAELEEQLKTARELAAECSRMFGDVMAIGNRLANAVTSIGDEVEAARSAFDSWSGIKGLLGPRLMPVSDPSVVEDPGVGGATAPSTLGAGRGARAPVRRGTERRVADGSAAAQSKEAPAAPAAGASDTPLKRVELEILGMLKGIAPDGLTWEELALATVRAPHGGSWNGVRAALRSGGWIEESADGRVTAGLRALQDEAVLIGSVPEPAELRALWSEKLGQPAAAIIDHLAKTETGAATPAAIGAAIGRAAHGGSWNGGVKALRTNNVAPKVGDEIVLHGLMMETPDA